MGNTHVKSSGGLGGGICFVVSGSRKVGDSIPGTPLLFKFRLSLAQI
jgi:hypothetical protein